MNYTKGEWETGIAVVESLSDKPQHCVGCKDNEHKIIALTGMVGAGDEQESIANARLIAAAPNMFELLKITINTIFNAPMFPEKYVAIQRISELIAGIEGR